MRHTTKSHTITLSGKTNSKVQGDFQRLEQVIMNLLSNAIKYSPNHKEVEVNISNSGNEVLCEVIDKGIGISDEHIKTFLKGTTGLTKNIIIFQGLVSDYSSPNR